MSVRLGLVGAGWIARHHLEALERLGRTELVGVASRTMANAAALTDAWGGSPFDELDRMLETARPDVVYVCVPPDQSVSIGERLVEFGIPFLTEKPLAADDAAGPALLAAAIERAGLIVAVGYHLRALDVMPKLRERLAERPPRMVLARWMAQTPPPAWWSRVDQGGGQVIEQATHLYDLARYLIGEADVIGAASARVAHGALGRDVADAAAAVLRFRGGAIGSFASAHGLETSSIEIAFASDGLLTTLRKVPDGGQGDWHVAFEDGHQVLDLRTERDPYEIQAAAFLDALDAGDPALVLSSYADALRTDRLTRAVVAATGAPG